MKNCFFKKFHKANKGMSLVEMIIAVTILSVAIAPLLYTFAFSAKYNAKARLKQKATSAAQSVMEHLKAYKLSDVNQKFDDGDFLDASNPATYEIPAGGDLFGKYTISGMKVSDSDADSGHTFDAVIEVSSDSAKGARKISDDSTFDMTFPTSNVFDPKIDMLYEAVDDSAGGSYAFDSMYVVSECIEKSGLEPAAVTSIEVSRTIYMDIYPDGNDAEGNPKYDASARYVFDYKIGGLTGQLVKIHPAVNDISNLRDFYFYYYPSYTGSSTVGGQTIKIGDDKLFINNRSGVGINFFVFKQKDPAKNTFDLAISEPIYKLNVYAGDDCSSSCIVYDCVKRDLSNGAAASSILVKKSHPTKAALVDGYITVDPTFDASTMEDNILTYTVHVTIFDHTADEEHNDPLSTMIGTVLN